MLVYIGLGLVLLAVYQVVQAVKPLVDGASMSASEWERVDDETEALLSRRDRLISELRELEFEAALAKVDAKDLPGLRDAFELEALDVTRRLEAEQSLFAARIDADVEARLGKGRKAATKPAAEADGEPVVSDAASESEPVVPVESAAVDSAGSPCAACDAPMPTDARFCDACGAPAGKACEACGVANRAEARFCKGCGAST